jgi:hypothetical protein
MCMINLMWTQIITLGQSGAANPQKRAKIPFFSIFNQNISTFASDVQYS